MQTLNDLMAEFYRKQTEMSAILHLMEEQIKARDRRIEELTTKKPEEQKASA